MTEGDGGSRLDGLLDEARRRGLWQVAGVYAVATWFLIQFGVTVAETLRLTEWMVRTLIGMTLAGLPVALALAWILRAPEEEGPALAGKGGGASGASQGFGPFQKALIVVCLLAGVGLWAWRRTLPPGPVEISGDRGTATAVAAADRPPEPPPPSASLRELAVLPFAVAGGDTSERYFAEGVSEEIRNRLARIPELRVVSRTSSHRYAGTQAPARRVAGELGVRALLEGSVQRSGRRLRVTVQLVDGAEDVTLWSDRFDRVLDDIFSVEDEIARAVARALRVELTAAGRDATPPERVDVEAHDLYLLGLHHWNRRTAPGLRRALAFFEDAVRLDPRYAPAHAGLASTYVLLPIYTGEPPEETMPRAREAAARALSLDSAMAASHATLGLVRTSYEFDWSGAEASFARALAANPSDATAHQWYGLMLDAVGRHDEALLHHEQARALDPFSLIIRESLGIHHLVTEKYPEAVEHLTRSLEMSPDFPLGLRFLAEVRLLTGRFPEAAEAVRRRAELTGVDPEPLLTALRGVAREADRGTSIRALRRAVDGGAVSRFEAAQWAALMELRGEALTWVEAAYRAREPLFFLVAVDPALAGLREEPRFRAVLRAMGLGRASAGGGGADPASDTARTATREEG